MKDPNEKDANGDGVKRMGKVGERIILSESKAFERFSKIAEHPTRVYEAFLQPVVGRTQAKRPLWTFPDVSVNPKFIVRNGTLMVAPEMLLEAPDEAPQLPAANGATASATTA